MSIPFILPLNEVFAFPTAAVGERAKRLAVLSQHHLPHPATAVITSSALQHVTDTNHATTQLQDLWKKARASSGEEQTSYLQQLRHHLAQLRWPLDFTKELQLWYHQQAEGEYVRVSSVSTTQDWVRGEVNVVESLVEIWALTLSQLVSQAGSNLYPPLTLEAQPSPDWSGLALTINPFTHAKTILIQAVQGVYDLQDSPAVHTTWEIDPRTNHVVHRTDREQNTQWIPGSTGLTERSLSKRQRATLSNLQLAELAHHIHKLKQTQLEHLKVQWQFDAEHGWLITDYSPFEHIVLPYQTATDTATVVATGMCLHPGYIQGPVRVIHQPRDLADLQTGEILFLEELKAAHLPHLARASGILTTQRVIGPIMLETIKKYGIPTLGQLQLRGSQLRSGMSVVIKAQTGQVLTAATSQLPSTKTATQLIVDTAYPQQLTELPAYDGVFVTWPYLQQQPQSPHLLSAMCTYPLLSGKPVWLRLSSTHTSEWERGLQLLKELSHSYATVELRVVINDITSPPQLTAVLEEAHAVLGSAYLRHQWWLHAHLPAHLAEVATYLHQPLAGMMIDSSAIHRHAYGLHSIQSDLPVLPTEPTFLVQWLEAAIHQIHQATPQYARIEHCQSLVYTTGVPVQTLTTAVTAGVDGVVVPLPQLETARTTIATAELNRLCQPSNS